MKLVPLSEPFTKSDILRDLGVVHAWSTDFWQSFDRAELFAPLGDAWSPADNVRHLIKSNRPVAQALKIPKLFLLLRFGFARRPSRSYSALKATYHEALGSGLKAGSFAASSIPVDQQTDERREQELAKLSQTFSDLSAAVQGWSEGALDRLRLPHPGLGLLTVREMLLFTLYHNTHHVLGVDRRRSQPSGVDSVLQALESAPLDDEPDEDDADGGLSEARREALERKGLSHDEVKRELGLGQVGRSAVHDQGAPEGQKA